MLAIRLRLAGLADKISSKIIFRGSTSSTTSILMKEKIENKERKATMTPKLSEDEIDDLLYYARIGDTEEFNTLKDELCRRESVTEVELLEAARDGESGNGVLHMTAANGHSGLPPFRPSFLSPKHSSC